MLSKTKHIKRVSLNKVHSFTYKRNRIRNTLLYFPTDIRKEGSAYDITIALGILAVSEQMNGEKLGYYLIMGELSLDGSLNSIKGALPIVLQAKKEVYFLKTGNRQQKLIKE